MNIKNILKKYRKEIITMFCVILFVICLPKILLIGSDEYCAKFDKTGELKGNQIYIYTYKIEGKIREGNIPPSNSKLTFDKLKKLECVKIRVSKIISYFSVITDNRVNK